MVTDRIEKGWQEIREASLPPDTPDNQLQQHRDYFFAGARFMLTEVYEAGELSEEAGEALLSEMEAELKDFIEKFVLRRYGVAGSA